MKYLKYIKRAILLIMMIPVCSFSIAQVADQIKINHKKDSLNLAYIQQPGWKTSAAVDYVDGDEMGKSFASNLSNTLIGRLPGLIVVPSGSEAGLDAPELYIRGISTFQSGKKVLILVDGFESSIDHLVAEEVESVTLLKDAAATAIYGSRGANGVLLVNTKRGKKSPLKVNLSTQMGFESALHTPEFLGSYDYANLYNEALRNDEYPELYTPQDLTAYKSGSDPYFHPDVSWYDQLLRKTAPVSRHNLSFNGGSEKARYFVLLNAISRDGLIKNTGDLSEFSTNSKFTQYNIRTNIDIDLTKRLTVYYNLGLSFADKANPASYDSESLFSLMSSLPPNAFPVYNPNGTYGGNSLYSNPWGNALETGYYTANYRTFQSVIKLTEQLDMITPGLSATAGLSVNNTFRGYSHKTRTYQRFFVSQDEDGNNVYIPFGANSALTADENKFDQWRNISFQSYLNYNRSFGAQDIEALLAYDLNVTTLAGNNLPYKHIGLGGRVTYTNNDKYVGEFSFGYYGSEAFARGKRFGFFPAVSLGWILSNEEFLKESSVISHLKLKASYGLTGNDNVGGQRFMYEQYYSYMPSYYYGQQNQSMSAYAEGLIANPDLTWEKEKELNVGFEATLFSHLQVSFDMFNQNRYDILAQPHRTVPGFLGMTMPYLNIGEVKNNGFEGSLGYSTGNTGDFQLSMNLSAWYAKNEIVYNAETLQKDEYLNRTGRSIGQPYLLEAAGFFSDDPDIQNWDHQVFAQVKPGDLKYKDQNDDGIIDQNDYYPVGKSNIPELTFGYDLNLKYKAFYVDALIQGVTGRSVYLSGYDFYAFQDYGKISEIALGRWTPETKTTATYPRLSSGNNLNNFQPSSFWQRNGNYIKLRSLELGYNVPGNIVNRIGLENARLFINGTNLLTFDYVKIADPEILSGYPAVRSYSIGAKIMF